MSMSDSAPGTATPFDGYHHLTMVAKNAVENVRFYRDILKLRLVKQTVNFDVPDTYHLYYGDEAGGAGTLLTFFEWPTVRPGTIGWGGNHHLAMKVATGAALAYWRGQLEREGVDVEGPFDDHGRPVIRFRDPDGLILELVAPAGEDVPDGAPALFVPAMGIGAIDHVAVVATNRDTAIAFYSGLLGCSLVGEGESRDYPGATDLIFAVTGGTDQRVVVTLADRASTPKARHGTGLTHHIAFNVPDDPTELAWQERIGEAGVAVTEQRDRKYFHSIYFNDPDGFLIEIATATPGFTVDEPLESLGDSLSLPPWLEENRAQLEQALTPLPEPS
jgi:glyoxalase family protein